MPGSAVAGRCADHGATPAQPFRPSIARVWHGLAASRPGPSTMPRIRRTCRAFDYANTGRNAAFGRGIAGGLQHGAEGGNVGGGGDHGALHFRRQADWALPSPLVGEGEGGGASGHGCAPRPRPLPTRGRGGVRCPAGLWRVGAQVTVQPRRGP